MSRNIVWNEQPSARMFHVFDRRRRSCGCWHAHAEASARAELARHRGGYMLIVDEYVAKLPHLGHTYRVVFSEATS